MKLPKLYRVVYLEIEWVTDTCEGGEHVQRWGVYYTPTRLVMKNGVKVWQMLDKSFNNPYFEHDDLDYSWHTQDLEFIEYIKENRNNPIITRSFKTIKQQKQDKVDLIEFNKLSQMIFH